MYFHWKIKFSLYLTKVLIIINTIRYIMFSLNMHSETFTFKWARFHIRIAKSARISCLFLFKNNNVKVYPFTPRYSCCCNILQLLIFVIQKIYIILGLPTWESEKGLSFSFYDITKMQRPALFILPRYFCPYIKYIYISLTQITVARLISFWT